MNTFAILLFVALAIGQAPPVPPVPVPPVPAGFTVKLPAKIEATLGRETLVTAETAGKVVRWRSLDDDLRVIPPDAATTTVYVIALRPGRFRLLAIGASDKGELSAFVEAAVIVEGPQPPPPPPTPPGPKDELTAKLQTAYSADKGPNKDKDRAGLAGFYAGAASQVELLDFASTSKLLDYLGKLRERQLPALGLVECRKVIAAELYLAIGDDQALTPELKTKARDIFNRIAQALDGVK